jgi:hypothetical protein
VSDRYKNLHSVFLGGCLLVDAHRRGIDHLHLLIARLMSGDDGVHQLVPDALLAPAVEAVIDRRVRPVSFRQIRPGRSETQLIKDAIQDPAVINSWHTARLVRQQRLDRPRLQNALVLGWGLSAILSAESSLAIT